jgi:hypothetical protein
MQGDNSLDGIVLPNDDNSDDAPALVLNPVEKLAIAQAFMNKVGKLTKTGVYDNLRGEVDDYFADVYEETGGKSFDVKLFGKKVGTYSITTSKPEPEHTEVSVEVVDAEEFCKWLAAFGGSSWKAVMAHLNPLAEELLKITGELPDGCEAHSWTVPADDGGRITRSTLKVNSDDVLDCIEAVLPEVGTMLLGSGE